MDDGDFGKEGGVYSGAGTVVEKLERARTELLDLSARNRLLNMPKAAKSAKIIELVDERSSEIFRLLVGEGKAFTFVPGMPSRKVPADVEQSDAAAGEAQAAAAEEDSDIIADLALPEDDEVDERGIAGRHSDTRLQTRFTPEGLQKRLLDLYFDARTLEDEQGVNVLYLALGALRWVDPNDAKNIRRAPLLLIPVALERGTAGERFRLRARPEDFATNLSLENFLNRIHGIRLPEFEATEDFDLAGYFAQVAQAVEVKDSWGVEPDVIVLGFFSFAKFMMYRDLDPQTWPATAPIGSQSLLKGLLSDGFEASEGLIPDDVSIDPIIAPSDMLHILDSDSSQTLAVHEVRKGRNLVIQGPPGTGKSQTIANLIAAAVADNKTVLFVAEKMAALEVVKRRLDAQGVGAACLELHSHKANKRAVLEEIRRTWENGAPRTGDVGSLNTRLGELRGELNDHAARMHRAHPASGLTPYQVIGQLVRLRAAGEKPNDIHLEAPETWSRDGYDERHKVLRELVERVQEIGQPSQHLWHGVRLASITPLAVERLTDRLAKASADSADLERLVAELAEVLHQPLSTRWRAVVSLVELAGCLAKAPLPPEALAAPEWADNPAALEEIVKSGEQYAELRHLLDGKVTEAAWERDTGAERQVLADVSPDAVLDDLETVASIARDLPGLVAAGKELATALAEPLPEKIDDILRLVPLAEHLVAAPFLPGATLADPVWDQGSGLPRDILAAVREFQAGRQELGGKLSDAAWDTDLVAARNTLAAHGKGLLRHLNGEWRRANRLVRSCLSSSEQPLQATLEQLDRLQKAKAAKTEFERDETVARAAFGSLWRGERSDAGQLEAVLEWMETLGDLSAPVRRIAAREPDRDALRGVLARLEGAVGLRDAIRRMAELSGKAEIDLPAENLIVLATSITDADRTTRDLFQDLPATLGERTRYLDRLAQGRRAAQAIDEAGPIAIRAFGPVWSGRASNWPDLKAATRWVRDNADILDTAARVTGRDRAADLATRIDAASEKLGSDLDAIAGDLELDLQDAFGASVDDIALSGVTERLAQWSGAGESLFKWVAYRDRADRGRALGCADLVNRLSEGHIAPAGVIPAFEMTYFEALHEDLVRMMPELGRFDGTLHTKTVQEFADLDLHRIHVSADETVRAHHRRMPPRDGGAIGPLGTLRNELQKKRGHIPIRKLIERAGPAVQALKPVFMMSPLSVAQFLTPGAVEFDLLVMDEASQIQPIDALGAVARARQVVVVGDPRQLPPTSFFARMTGGGDDDEDEGGRVADIESILGLFTARGLPMRMLRWHYRSRHQSLIAVSNRQFYENKLFIVPSPYTAEAGMGLRFHHIPDGIFEAGGKRCNQVEAKVVAQAIIRHALEFPDLSLGVAAFSVAQRRAILDELELLRRAHPETEGFFHAHPSEPFFVKNLENVQGDERDVIFISVGYGPTVPGGRVPMRFGPLGSEGGERRLNVLISRAKQRCEVFASMTDEDIEPDFAQSRKGVFAFRLFLHYARTGRLTMAEATGRDFDSVFEEQVAKALQDRGYHVHRQVGLAGFFIDLAIADPERPGRYLLGIECDGAAYHDALSARDRDRLRQSVLESHGWTIHRIWSTDWFQRPSQELDQVIAAIDAARAEDQEREVRRAKPVLRITSEEVGQLTVMGIETGAKAAESERSGVIFYKEAVITRGAHQTAELHEVPREVLVGYVEAIAEFEGPVHVDEVVTRIREAWGLKRAGGRIREAIMAAIAVAGKKGTIQGDDGFIWVPGLQPVLRNRANTVSPGVRKPEMISLPEIAGGAVEITWVNFGATQGQLVSEISKALGFKSTSESLRTRVMAGITTAIEDQRLVEANGLFQISPDAP